MSDLVEVKCSDCGEVFCPEQEGMWVRTSRRGGKEVCSSCSYDYTFTCGLCGCAHAEKDPEANEAGSDVFVMVRRCSSLGGKLLKRGLYRILSGPFLTGALIGEPSFLEDRIQWLAAVPESPHLVSEHACAPVCEDCQRKHLGRVRHWRRKAA